MGKASDSMIRFIFEVFIFAITITFLLAWGYVKKQRKTEELLNKLFEKCESKILKGFEYKDLLSKKEIEAIIEGTKASLFWSKNKVNVQNANLVIDRIIENMTEKGLIVEDLSNKKRAYRLNKGSIT
ncbi:MAG: hypothetical protein ACOYVK_22120 [Bacillota bacterium]